MNRPPATRASQRTVINNFLKGKRFVCANDVVDCVVDNGLPEVAKATVIEILRESYYIKRGNGKNTIWEQKFARFDKYKKGLT